MKLICYLSNGYPSIEESTKTAFSYVNAGCDIIEIDFPGRDPYLESEYLANRMEKALQACDDYNKYMQAMANLKKALPDTKFILLLYEDTLEEIGLERFVDFCKENEFKELIFVGLKNERNKDKLISEGLHVSCYVQYHLLPEEVEHAKRSNGFVYLQAKPTDGNINPDYPELKDCVQYLRNKGIDRPIYCGVGIHTPEDVEMVKQAKADGVFIGSAILKLHDDIPELEKAIADFKRNC